MSDLHRPLGLRRRDARLVLIVGAVALCNAATTALYWATTREDLRRARIDLDAALAPVATCATNALTASDAACRAVASGVVAQSSSLDDDGASAPSPPVVLGWGQTKGFGGRRYIYRDTRTGAGEVRRDYFPLPASRHTRRDVSDRASNASERSEVEADVPPGDVE